MVKKSSKTVKMSLCSLSLWVLLLQLLLLVQSSSLNDFDQTKDDSGSDDGASKRTDQTLDEGAENLFKLLATEGRAAREIMKDTLIAHFRLLLNDYVTDTLKAFGLYNQRCEVTLEDHEKISHEITSEIKLMYESLEIFENELKKSNIEMNVIDDGFKAKLETLKKDNAVLLKNINDSGMRKTSSTNETQTIPKQIDDNDPNQCIHLTPESSDPGPRKMPFFPWFSSVSSKTRDAIKKFLNFDNDGNDSKMNSVNLAEEDGGGRNISKALPFVVAGSTSALLILLGYILHPNRIHKQDKRNKLERLVGDILKGTTLPPPMPPHNPQNPPILELTTQDSDLNLWNSLLLIFMILLVVAALVFYFLFYKKKRKIKPMKHKLESSMIDSKTSSENSSGNKSSVSSQTGQKTKKSKSPSKRSSSSSRKRTAESKIKK